MAERTFAGREDLGGRLIDTLRVGQIVRRDPEPLWSVVCERCRSEGVEKHARLTNGSASCRASICGRAAQVREAIEDTPAKARRREQQAEAKQRREAEAKQAARLAAQEATFKSTANQLASTIREGILKGRDDEVYEDPATRGRTMPQVEATVFNRDQFAIFCQRNPNYAELSRHNLKVIEAYLERNGVDKIVSAVTLERAVKRLDSYGLLERPAQAPTPPPPPAAREVNLTIEPAQTETPRLHVGIDADGRECELTDAQVERMTAKEFRRAFKLHQPDLEAARAWNRL
jgi:hypothetical protein